jgi:hypothetical protein
MPDVKISALPAGTANASAVVPATNAAGTTTEKITLGGIRDLVHATRHQTGGADAVANVVNSPTQLSADQNNYTLPAADIVRLDASAARNVTGFVAGTSGQAVLLINVGSHAITLKHQSASSTDVNRIVVPWAGDLVLAASGGAAVLIYDNTAQRWRAV